MKLSENFFAELFERYIPDADSSDLNEIYKSDGCSCGRLCGLLLYLLVLEFKPNRVLEFSSAYGYSTACLAFAMRRLGKKDSMITCEIDDKKFKSKLEARIHRNQLHEYLNVVWGDALHTLPKVLRDGTKEVDFCFVDSCHKEWFADRYIKEIFPLMSERCVICVHDIAAKTADPQGDFNTNEPHNGGEWRALKRWLRENDLSYTLVHSIFGGKEDRSNKLPVNEKLYSRVNQVLGIDIRKDVAETKKAPVLLICKNLKRNNDTTN